MALLAIVLILPAPLELAGSWAGRAAAADEIDNRTITTPAFLDLALYWKETFGQRYEALDLKDFFIILNGNTEVDYTPIPVAASAGFSMQIYAKGAYLASPKIPLVEVTETAPAAGNHLMLAYSFNTTELATAHFIPVRLLFRLYDNTTGAGLPADQFNLTVQFPSQTLFNLACCVYLQSQEVPIANGYLDTYYSVNVTLRVRDYFGNLLYNATRAFNLNESKQCLQINQGTDCGLFTTRFETWDIPLAVYSFKVYNQKPDQFIKVKLYWNSTGAGEEVYAPNSGLFPDWWNSAYTYRQRLKIAPAATIGINYTINLTLAGATLAGKVQGDYRDLRVLYWSGTQWLELNRTYDGSRMQFRSASTMAPGGTDRSYYLYYGNALAGAPPSYDTYSALILREPGLVSYWKLDETSGTTVVDAFDSHPGTLAGTNTLGIVGVDGTGIQFGTAVATQNNRATIAAVTTPNTLSIEVWINVTGTQANFRPLFGNRESANDWDVMLYLISGTLTLRPHVMNGAGQTRSFDTAAPLVVNNWNHVVETWDPSGLRAYVAGTEDANSPLSVGASSNTQNLVNQWFIGADLNEINAFERMDAVAMYSAALSAAQVKTHFNYSQYANATVALDSSQGFEWFESPTETVERFLNPGYYELQIVTDNRTGVQTKANLGVNITEANYYMVSGTNITRFIGDFTSIYSQTQVILNAFRPDVISIGKLLPVSPTELQFFSVDKPGGFVRDDPFEILEGTVAYAGASGTNVTAFMPAMSSSSDDGALLTTMTVKQDRFDFNGLVPGQTHVWINYTSNGTNIWENATLPPTVTLPGIQSDVFVVTNQTVSTVRISQFRAIWEFSVRHYPTDKKYEATLTLNNTMNRTVLNPEWFVAFPENATIDLTTAALQDLDNNAWLVEGQHFSIAQSGYYMAFDQLNASSMRRFFFRYYDLNATGGQSVPVITVNSLEHASFQGNTAYWTGQAVWANPFTAAYSGEIIVKLNCPECQKVDTKSIRVVDTVAQRLLDASEFYTSGNDIHITKAAVGQVPVGGSRQYAVYARLELTAESHELTLFGPIGGWKIGPIAVSVFLFLLMLEVGLGVVAFIDKDKPRRTIAVVVAIPLGAILFTMYLMQNLSLVR